MTFKEAKDLKLKLGDTKEKEGDTYKVLVAPVEKGGVSYHSDFFRRNETSITDEDALRFGDDFYVSGFITPDGVDVFKWTLTEKDL